MYYAHFGLTQPPFKITPNTEFFFAGGNRGDILRALIYAITHGDGIVKVTGEVGSGKTMLCRMLSSRLPEDVEIIYLANPSVSPEDVLHAIAFELHLPVGPDASRITVTHALHDYLLERHAQEKRVVMLVEEAQSMPVGTLEEIRLLSNLETEHNKLLQIVLFGQPELDAILSPMNMRQLKERITHSFTLGPLAAGDIAEYLRFRLATAGYRGPDLFPPAVIRYIAKASKGLTRRVNIIADKILLAAYAEGTRNITLKHARLAVRDSEFSHGTSDASRRHAALAAVAGILVLVLGAAGYALYGKHPAPATALPPSAQPPGPTVTKPTMMAAATPAPPLDIVQARLDATSRWLAHAQPHTYTIQLMGTANPAELKNYLMEIGQIIEPGKIFVYRTTAKGRPSLTVLYGSFADRAQASQALAQLPETLRRNHPYLRSVGGIRAELSASADGGGPATVPEGSQAGSVTR